MALATLTIISGGQTGADRAALDFALAHGLSHGGWCPRGRLAEDGRIPDRYQLRETRSRRYAERTERNVRDSDATVVFTISPSVRGGTALTLDLAGQLQKPCLHLARDSGPTLEQHAARLQTFFQAHQVGRCNVAGPRESQEPEVAIFVQQVLAAAVT